MDSNHLTARDNAIDLLKSIAIFGVIVIHICSSGYGFPVASFNWVSTVFWGSLTRSSVPIFLMCSGALLLNPEKEMTIKKIYLRSILRIVLAMFVWAMAYKIYHLIGTGNINIASLIQAVKEVLVFNQEFHLYYIHIMIIVYAFLPLTRLFIKNANKNELIYALVIWFVLGIIYPTVKTFWPFNLIQGIPVQWAINMTYASVGYGILGYYLTKYPLSLKCSILLFTIGFISVFGLTVFMSVRINALYENFLEGMSIGVALLGTGIFGFCCGLKSKMSDKAISLCTELSKASFCIYLVHVFVIYLFSRIGISAASFPCLISIPILSSFTLSISYLVYLVLSRIPLVNRWLI